VIVIATKADKIPKSKWQKHLKITKETLDFDPDDAIVLFSSETGEGKDKAWSIIQAYMNK
jgi:GTP-binding protein